MIYYIYMNVKALKKPFFGLAIFLLLVIFPLVSMILGRPKILLYDRAHVALDYIRLQLSFGPRHLGVPGNLAVREWLVSELEHSAPITTEQPFSALYGESVISGSNVIARFSPEKKNRIVIGTHFDTRALADQDLEAPNLPVPGANDGASGTALLLSIADILGKNVKTFPFGIDLVFFDGEEMALPPNGELKSVSDWNPLGSKYFSENLKEFYDGKNLEEVVIVDMVCDKDLHIGPEYTSYVSAPEAAQKFFTLAHDIFPNTFSLDVRSPIYDDHTPFQKRRIPSFLIIDLDYQAFHTTRDVVQNCSEESLDAVGKSLMRYLAYRSISPERMLVYRWLERD